MFAARIRNWMKTLRKRNAMVGFATQSAADALDSSIASAIVEQTATAIFMPNPKARAEDYCEGFGLSAHEFELIRTLPAHSRCFLVRQAQPLGRRAARPHRHARRADGPVGPRIQRAPPRRAPRRGRRRSGAWYPMLTRSPWPGSPPSDDYWLEAAE